MQEYRRLLYVALTRAQYRLYVCGWQNQRPTREAPCWHALCEAGWTGLAEPVAVRHAPADRRARMAGPARRCGSAAAQTAPPRRDERVAGLRVSGHAARLGVGAAAARAEPAEAAGCRRGRAAPSRPTLSPLAVAGRDRFKRGLLVHRLLQSLPELPAAERDSGRAAVSRPAGACAAAATSRRKSAPKPWPC